MMAVSATYGFSSLTKYNSSAQYSLSSNDQSKASTSQPIISSINPTSLSQRFRKAIIQDDLLSARRIYEKFMDSKVMSNRDEQGYYEQEDEEEDEEAEGYQDDDGQGPEFHLTLQSQSPPRRPSQISNSSTIHGERGEGAGGYGAGGPHLNPITNHSSTFRSKQVSKPQFLLPRPIFQSSPNISSQTLTAKQRQTLSQQKSLADSKHFDIRNVSRLNPTFSGNVNSHHNSLSNLSSFSLNHHNPTSPSKRKETCQSREERTPSLILAIEKKASIELIEWLLDQGHERMGEPSRDLEDNTIIAVAANHGRTDVIELYCQNPNLDVPSLLDYSDGKGRTALHLGALKGYAEVVRLLVDLGADIDLPDREGNTALHYASSWGHLTVVQTLIERSCSFASKNNSGFTASDFAFTHGVQAAVEAFGREQFDVMNNIRKNNRRKIREEEKEKEFREREKERREGELIGYQVGYDETSNSGENQSGSSNAGLGLGMTPSGVNPSGIGTPIRNNPLNPESASSTFSPYQRRSQEEESSDGFGDREGRAMIPQGFRSNSQSTSRSPIAMRHHPSLPQLSRVFNSSSNPSQSSQARTSNSNCLTSLPKPSSSDSLFDSSLPAGSSNLPTSLPPPLQGNSNSNTSMMTGSNSSSTIASGTSDNLSLSSIASKMRLKDKAAMGEYLSKNNNKDSNQGISNSSTPIKNNNVQRSPIGIGNFITSNSPSFTSSNHNLSPLNIKRSYQSQSSNSNEPATSLSLNQKKSFDSSASSRVPDHLKNNFEISQRREQIASASNAPNHARSRSEGAVTGSSSPSSVANANRSMPLPPESPSKPSKVGGNTSKPNVSILMSKRDGRENKEEDREAETAPPLPPKS